MPTPRMRASDATTPTTLLVLVAVVGFAALVLAPSSAHAHSGIQSYVYVSITPTSVDGRVEYPVGDLAEVLDVELGDSPTAATEFVTAHAAAIRSYTAEHLALADGDGDWPLSFTGDVGVLQAAGGYVVVPFDVEQRFDGAPRSFRAEFDGIIHANPERDALFLIENDWGTARFANEGDHLLGFSVGMTSQAIELDDVGALASMRAVRGLGTDAVRTGIDHLLFVVALVAPVALVARGGHVRGAAPTVSAATRRAATLLLASAVAHSLLLWTLVVAGVDASTDAGGVLVAASVGAMAVYGVWRFTERELVVVVALSAVQGIGFAGDAARLRLDHIDTPLALIAFNIGIEVGVVVVALLVFPLLLALRRTRAAAVALYGVTTVICSYSAAWLIERTGLADIDVARVANPLRVWPRNLWLMLLALAGAGALSAWTARRGELRPVETHREVPTEDRELVAS